MGVMNADQFIKRIEEYYGAYANAVRAITRDYLKGMSERDLDRLYVAVIENFSNQFRVPPDVAIIRQFSTATEESVEAEARHEFRRIVGNVNVYRDMIIENVAAQEALKDCGGYVYLCNSDRDELQWIEKRFVSSYRHYRRQVPDVHAERLRGIADQSEPIVLSSRVKDLERKYLGTGHGSVLTGMMDQLVEGMQEQ